MKKFLTICFAILVCFSVQSVAQLPTNVLVNIVKAEDERRFDKTLEDLMKNQNEKIRARAALAAGRIGDERAVPMLVNLLENNTDAVRSTAAFALGEIESIKAADSVLKNLKNPSTLPEVRARLVEAAGKIAAANDAKNDVVIKLGETILDVLNEEVKKSKQDRLTILLGLTAILRAKPKDGDVSAAKFLTSKDARVRADAANTLSRIRAKNATTQLQAMLRSDNDAIARANAARALGAAEDKDAFDILLNAAGTDADSRVRVSAIRSLGSLKNAQAADKLLERGATLLADYTKSKSNSPTEKNELLEIAATLGRILPNANDERAVKFLNDLRRAGRYQSIEPEIALARVAPETYLKSTETLDWDESLTGNFGWQQISSLAQGTGELANSTDETLKAEAARAADMRLVSFMVPIRAPQRLEFLKAMPDVLRSFAAFKTADAPKTLRDYLKGGDVFVRATAAELIGDLPPSEENIQALNRAFDFALISDSQYNDAQLAILDALQKQGAARGALLLALKDSDYLVRQKALQIIKTNNLTKNDAALKIQYDETEKNSRTLRPFSNSSRSQLGVVLSTNADYTRAVSRKNARAILTTDKGTFTIEFFPEAAPLTVDNFIKLARANYFNGLEIHRVVPNFVMQDGDPRGDGNGGPGWQIRCELNTESYERGAVGMALSGKDTGGSQWFVTHSPQPHLDGGYTVFGRVNETDMKIVDNLVRGDKILSVKIVEGNSLRKSTKRRKE
jgi:cyclophilin family peptidyl-prolyl cis-trans isomerase/HEAT repeat protein